MSSLILALSPLATPTAHASSVYDDVVHPTSVLYFADDDGNPVDISTSWASRFLSSCGSTAYNDFLDALDGGSFSVSQDATLQYGVEISWAKTAHTIPTVQFGGSSPFAYAYVGSGYSGDARFYHNIYTDEDACGYYISYRNQSYGGAIIAWEPAGSVKPFFSTYTVSYPGGYEGESIPNTSPDLDGDGLTQEQELMQGTSDDKIDTDGDGLSDFTESVWNTNRDDQFCAGDGPCADYPDPLKKDVYIEIDWMDDGVHTYKPNGTELSDIEDLFGNHDINMYFDTGEYGGGNELPDYTDTLNYDETSGELDIHDYKYGGDVTDTGLNHTLASQFSLDRSGIWRYMIFGVERIGDRSSSVDGITEVLGDDSIIASQNPNIDLNKLGSEDRAISGLMTHEIGHYLCLSSDQLWVEQDGECVYGGIDEDAGSDYTSVMNYRYYLPTYSGLTNIDYDSGTEHDDWSAIQDGMGAFIFGEALTPEYAQVLKTRGHKSIGDATRTIKGNAEKRRVNDVKKHRTALGIRM